MSWNDGNEFLEWLEDMIEGLDVSNSQICRLNDEMQKLKETKEKALLRRKQIKKEIFDGVKSRVNQSSIYDE